MKKHLFLLVLFILTIPFFVNAESNYLYDVLKETAEGNTQKAKEYTGEHNDTINHIGNKKIYYWYYNNYSYPSTFNNNVIFGNYCWLMVRTTDTGGVKLLYNGSVKNHKCEEKYREGITSYAQVIAGAFNNNSYSPAYFGYMYNPDNIYTDAYNNRPNASSIYGNSVSYSDGMYKLIDVSDERDATHHYTCNSNQDTCEKVLYYYNNTYSYGFELSGGKNFEEAIVAELNADDVNKVDSTVKSAIDNWYANNMTNYTKYLEDVIFCNDRYIDKDSWNLNSWDFLLEVGKKDDTLDCTNITDMFSVSNEKAKLTYPVGLLTLAEVHLSESARLTYLRSGMGNWLMTPTRFERGYAKSYIVNPTGSIGIYEVFQSIAGARPVVSLRPNIRYVSGDGSQNKPYVLDYDIFHSVNIIEKEGTQNTSINIDDLENVVEGESITIIITPIEGYTIDKISIVDEEDNDIFFEKTNNENEYSFTMPKSNITITPFYKKVDAPNDDTTNPVPTNPNTGKNLFLTGIILFGLIISTILFQKKSIKK